jgi:hypothetical protein
MLQAPGTVALFGSGETSASGRRIHDWLLHRLTAPVNLAVLETPAGFQPNSAQVAEEVAEFFRTRLPGYRPRVSVIPARRRGSAHSPDDPSLVAPLVRSNVIFLGPGSPTYAARQLQDSLLWQTVVARHRLGATLILASAATIAASAQALPVYEIYKAGEDLHWCPGLNFFGPYGLSLALVSHWDNTEGGAGLDTSRCFMGQERFRQLLALLPANVNVVGIDEHTALIFDFAGGICRVMGRGGVTVLRQGQQERFNQGQSFSVAALGPFGMPRPANGIAPDVWASLLAAQEEPTETTAVVPPEVLSLARERQAARARRDWLTADELRARITALGWQVRDTDAGFDMQPIGPGQ